MNFTQSTPLNPYFSMVLRMNTMGHRLKEALRLREMQPPGLVALTKLSKGTVYNILNDTTQPDKVWSETADKICAALSIRREWLLHGRGEINSLSSFTIASPPSQRGRPDFYKMAGAVSVLTEWLAITMQPTEWVKDAVLLETAYEIVEEFGGEVVPSNVIDLVKVLARRLKQGETGDERGKIQGASAAVS